MYQMAYFQAKMHHIGYWLGLCPTPCCGAYNDPPDPHFTDHWL